MADVTEWRREVDRWYVQGYVQSLRRVKDARAFFIAHGFHPLYAADKIEKLMHTLDDLTGDARYTITDAGRAMLKGGE